MSCLDEKGRPLDWFIVYKIPKLETSPIDTLSSGYGYAFITDKSLKSVNDWTLSDLLIKDKQSLFGRTIDSVIKNIKKSKLSYIVYNDDTPGNSKTI